MKREPGFYWIRTSSGWEVAEWRTLLNSFRITDGGILSQWEVEEISDRILNPDEQADEARLADRPGEDN